MIAGQPAIPFDNREYCFKATKPPLLTSIPTPVPYAPHSTARWEDSESKHSDLWRRLAGVGSVILTAGGLLMLCSPWLEKRWPDILKKLKQVPFPEHLQRFQKKLNRFLGTYSAVSLAWKLVGVGYLMQDINHYQTAFNTKQPSMLLSQLLGTTASIAFLIREPNLFLKSLGLVSGMFYAAGKQNDIENSNHLERRREWDFHRLANGFASGGNRLVAVSREVASFMRFVAQDLKRIFSLKPWRTVKTGYRNPKFWETPQPAQLAISAQAALVSSLLANAGTVFKPFSAIPAILQPGLDYASKAGVVVSELCLRIPILLRGWQNRDDLDGKLILLGAPLMITGRMFQISQGQSHLNGLSFLGSPFWTKGLLLNSQERLSQINYLKYLHGVSLQKPKVTAHQILQNISRQPGLLLQMRSRMGARGLEFVLSTLRQAEQSCLRTGVSLSSYLEPVISATAQ